MGHLGSNYEVSLLTKGFPPLQGWYGMAYEDPGGSYYEDRYRERVLKGLGRRAKAFGYELTEVGAAQGVS
jgi:hypothetical protein